MYMNLSRILAYSLDLMQPQEVLLNNKESTNVLCTKSEMEKYRILIRMRKKALQDHRLHTQREHQHLRRKMLYVQHKTFSSKGFQDPPKKFHDPLGSSKSI